MHRLKVSAHGCSYSIPQLKIERVSYRQMGHLIREGHELDVKTDEGLDYTKETLTKIALYDLFPPNVSNEIISVLSDIIDEEKLYLIIENGGIYDYLARKARNAINPRI